jgi:flagellar motor switch protein FliG
MAELSGTERAAILLMTLGEKEAAQVIRYMDAEEVQRLGEAMAALKNVSRDQAGEVLNRLLDSVGESTPIGTGSRDYLRKVLVGSLGERRAEGLLSRILKGRESRGIEALKWMDPQAVAQVVQREHPQIVATVLAFLPARQAADVLALLPEALRVDVAVRIANLEDVPESALKALDEIVDRQTEAAVELRSSRVGGIRVAADIINLLEPVASKELMESIREQDEELGERIQDKMFVFENLLSLDDRSMQMLLREVASEVLATALKGADPRIAEKIYRNMSKRAAEILRDDVAARGPVRLSEVEGAQKEILSAAQRLAEEGQIVLGAGGEQFV